MSGERSGSQIEVQSEAWWLRTFEEYDVKVVALHPGEDGHLIQFMEAQPGWTLDFQGAEGVLFVRSDVARYPCKGFRPSQGQSDLRVRGVYDTLAT